MTTQANMKVRTDDNSEDEEIPPLEEASDEEIGTVDGEALMIRRYLSVKIKEDGME